MSKPSSRFDSTQHAPAAQALAKRAIVAARVSTDAQAEYGRSLATQIEACRKYAEARGFEVIAEIVDDCSGTIPVRDRPGGRQIYDLIDRRAADALIFYTVDRATRDEDLIDLATLRRDVRLAGIELHYVDVGQADLSPIGGIVDTIRAALAAEERRKITKRNMDGRLAKARAGLWVGSGSAPYGYLRAGKGRDGRLAIDEAQAQIVLRAYRLYGGIGERPHPLRDICDAFNREGIQAPGLDGKRGRNACGRGWYPTTLGRILRNPVYSGRLVSHGQEIAAPELAIVDATTAAAVAARFERNRALARRNRRREYLLAGHLKCSCGRSMCGNTVVWRTGERGTYRCCGRALPSTLATCTESDLPRGMAEELVWDKLTSVFDPDLFRGAVAAAADRLSGDAGALQARQDDLDQRIERARRRLSGLSSKVAGLEGSAQDAILDQVKDAGRSLDALRAERAKIGEQIQAREWTAADREDLAALAGEIRAALAEEDFEGRRYLLDQLGVECHLARDAQGLRRIDGLCTVRAAPPVLFAVEVRQLTNAHLNPQCVVVLSFSVPLDGQSETTVADLWLASAGNDVVTLASTATNATRRRSRAPGQRSTP